MATRFCMCLVASGCTRPHGRVRIETLDYLGRYKLLRSCTHPHGRVRIETGHRWVCASLRVGCTRPHGRVRIETIIVGNSTTRLRTVAPAPTGGRGLKPEVARLLLQTPVALHPPPRAGED